MFNSTIDTKPEYSTTGSVSNIIIKGRIYNLTIMCTSVEINSTTIDTCSIVSKVTAFDGNVSILLYEYSTT